MTFIHAQFVGILVFARSDALENNTCREGVRFSPPILFAINAIFGITGGVRNQTMIIEVWRILEGLAKFEIVRLPASLSLSMVENLSL